MMKFRNKINEVGFKEKIKTGDKQQIEYELNQINKKIEEYLRSIE